MSGSTRAQSTSLFSIQFKFALAMMLMVACWGVFLHAQVQPPAADITGQWVGTAQMPFGEIEFSYDLKMDKDGTLHGVHHGMGGDSAISEGRVDGTRISFAEQADFFGSVQKLTSTGEIDGDTIKLSPGMPTRPVAAGPPGGGPGAGGPPPGPGTGMAPGPPGGMPGGFPAVKLVLHRGAAAPSYRAGPLDYASLPKIELPAISPLPANGLAKTPPMGWNSWNKFHTKIDDKTVRGIADAMVANGMKEAGYTYIVIDDGWQSKRDGQGKIVPNPNFPDMKALADYVHSKGLKIGIYSSPGPRTCGGFEGSYGHEEQDAQSYAAWGFDYLKYDWCSASRVFKPADQQSVYQKMGAALQKTGRPIVFALCQYGENHVEEWGRAVGGNLWRTTGDISDRYDSMIANGNAEAGLASSAAPGHWNDPDMLEVGNGGMTSDEYKTHFSLWAELAAPLLAGNDVRNLSDGTREILLNKEVIAVDQDALGQQATRISTKDDADVWARPLKDGSYAVVLVNRSTAAQTIAVNWTDLKLVGSQKVRDLWAHKDLGSIAEGFSSSVPAHGAVMIRVSE